jgi:hypothetical protein
MSMGGGDFRTVRRLKYRFIFQAMQVTNTGLVLDIEAGDARNSRGLATKWVQDRLSVGVKPTIYTSKSSMLYLGGLACDYWLADPTGVDHVIPGTVATQWKFAGGYDLSSTVDYWPRDMTDGKVDTMPNGKMVADGGFQVTRSGKGYWLFGDDGGVFAYGDAAFKGSLPGIGVKPNSPVSRVIIAPDEQGYWMVSDGDWGVFGFGSAEYLGHPA